MKQKIEWYREVLDLEPGSRVFFPLAKLLAANGQTADAISTLRQGLLRHPDNVEARLLLVELLYLQDDDAGVQSEINHLGGTFSLYPVFWKAWSDKLSKNPESHDASLALRFFAAALQGKTVNWADVVVQGLCAVLRDAENSPAPRRTGSATKLEETAAPSEEGASPECDATHEALTAEGLAEEIPEAPPLADSGLPVAPSDDLAAAVAGELADEMAEAPSIADADLSPDDMMLEAQGTQDTAASPDAFALDAAEDLSPDDDMLAEDALAGALAAGIEADLSPDDLGEDFPEETGVASGALEEEGEDAALAELLSDTLPEMQPDMQPGMHVDALADTQADVAANEEALLSSELADAPLPSQDAFAEDDGDDISSDDEEEAFSLRTRSMAEVLAEQGDIAGALDIYHELLAASGEEERPALSERAQELQLRLESPASSEHKTEERAVQPGTESTRLVNLLESLAQRLEDRAR